MDLLRFLFKVRVGWSVPNIKLQSNSADYERALVIKGVELAGGFYNTISSPSQLVAGALTIPEEVLW